MFTLNNIQTKKIGDNILLTNEYGNWTVLSKKEYKNFKFGIIPKNIQEKLEKNNIIITQNNTTQIYNRVNYMHNHLSRGTGLHIIIPTLRCNFTCNYCYALRAPENAQNKDMSPEIVDKTIEFIINSPSKNLTFEFSGGEPLIRFDLIKQAVLKAIELASKKKKQINFAIITNGSLINDEMIEFFKKYKIGICLSLDGPKKLHNSNRIFTTNKTGTYDTVNNKIKELTNKGLNINALPVIVKDSLDNWKEIVDEYINQGFVSLRFKYISNFGFASNNWKKLSYTPEEYLDTWKNVINYMLELNKKGVLIVENITTIILKKILKKENISYAELQSPCGAVITQLVYDYDGKIYTCDEARTTPEFQIGDVKQSTYANLLEHKTTKTIFNISNLNTYCENCSWNSFCGICPLEIYKENNGFITNIPSNYRCKIHKGMFQFIFEKIINEPDTKELFEKWLLIGGGTKGFYSNLNNPFKESD